MDALESAVVDITLLVATARALAQPAVPDEKPRRRRERLALRRELKRAVASYVAVLSRSEPDQAEQRLLDRCRVEAERQMPGALARQAELDAMLRHEPDSLRSFTSSRHDLWRMSHVAMHLNLGTRMLRCAGVQSKVLGKRGPARRVQRHLRRAIEKYVKTLIRGDRHDYDVIAARRAATRQLDDRCQAAADAVAQSTNIEMARRVLSHGVSRPLRHLVMDWTEASRSSDGGHGASLGVMSQ